MRGNTHVGTSIRQFLLAILFLSPFIASTQDSLAYTLQDSLRFVAEARSWNTLPATAKDSLPDWQIASAVQVFAETIVDTVRLRRLNYYNVSQLFTAEEEAFKAAKKDTLVTKDSLAVLALRLKALKEARKIAQKEYETVNATFEFSQKVAVMKPAARRKNLEKVYSRCRSITHPAPPEPVATVTPVVEAPPPPPVPEVSVEIPPAPVPDSTAVDSSSSAGWKSKLGKIKPKVKEKAPEKPAFATYKVENDVMLNPPMPPCVIAVERKDAFTGTVYRETSKGELFRFTNAVMKKSLPEGQPHIICKAALAGDASSGLLLLNFTIKDPNARRTFGGLPPKSILQLKFMDGDIITLFNEGRQEGQFDQETGTAVFAGQYAFQPAVLKKLEKAELDQIRVAWSTGYEDYNVHHVNLFMQQAPCLRQ